MKTTKNNTKHTHTHQWGEPNSGVKTARRKNERDIIAYKKRGDWLRGSKRARDGAREKGHGFPFDVGEGGSEAAEGGGEGAEKAEVGSTRESKRKREKKMKRGTRKKNHLDFRTRGR